MKDPICQANITARNRVPINDPIVNQVLYVILGQYSHSMDKQFSILVIINDNIWSQASI